MSHALDVHKELAEAAVTTHHRRLGLMMAALTLFDGYDTFNPAYVIHYVAGPWALRPAQAGFLVSSGLIGFLVGAAAHGMVADRIGRRGTLLAGLWITSLFTLATALFADGFWPYCGLRLLTGLGLGVLLPLATTYIAELAPQRIANTFTIWGVALGWATGGTLAGLAGVFATPVFGWHSLYWIGSLSFVLLGLLHVWLPESVKFLALRGREEEIRVLMGRLRPERADLYRDAKFTLVEPMTRKPSVATLLAPRYRRTTLAIWTSSFLSLFCVFGLSGWIPTVMMARGETFSAGFGFGALMQIMSFVGGLACGHIADRRGASRGVLALWWALGGGAVLLLLFDARALDLVCTAAAGFFIIGAQFVLNNFTAASYETDVRATAVGMELSVGRVGGILGPFVVGLLQQTGLGPSAMFVAIGTSASAAGLAICFAIPGPSSAPARSRDASDTSAAPSPQSPLSTTGSPRFPK